MTGAGPLVTLRGVRVRRAERWALDGVDLDVSRAETLAVLGPNGAGKSTLIRVLSLVEAPTEGQVRWEALGNGDRLAARRRIATVAQDPYLFEGSVEENVAQGLRYRGATQAEVALWSLEALLLCRVSALARRRARELSGGEARRVAIARALATRPDLLLLDEALAHVDEATKDELVALFAGLRSLGTAVVLATHDLSDAVRLAGRVFCLREGRPDAAGTENLLLGEVRVEEGMHWFVHPSGVRLAVATNRTGRAGAKLDPAELILSAEPIHSSARNCLRGKVLAIDAGDPVTRVRVDLGTPIVADVTPQSARELGLSQGKEVYVTFKATSVRIV